MDLSPVERIGAISPLSVRLSANDVAPPFAIDRAVRMEEDTYSASTKQQERGLEDEDEEEAKEDGTAPTEVAPDAPTTKVNFFA